MKKLMESDIDIILSKKTQFDYDYWTTKDLRLLKGSPFNAIEAPLYLAELGVSVADPLIQESIDLLFSVQRDDGRFKVYPTGGMYPCQTAFALTALCQLGQAEDPRLEKSFQYFLDTQQPDGGWKCNKYSFGRGPETEYSTPLTTLFVLKAFTYYPNYRCIAELDQAVDFLLRHWEIKEPISPCHYGIGTLFMQIEFPLSDYNIFNYVFVLSHYPQAVNDPRFQEAFSFLQSKTVDGEIIVERHSPRLNALAFCKKGQPSGAATKYYQKILENIALYGND